MTICLLSSLCNFLHGNVPWVVSISNIITYAHIKKYRLLAHDTYLRPEPFQINTAQIVLPDFDFARVGIIISFKQLCDGRLATATASNKRDLLSFLYGQIHFVEHFYFRTIRVWESNIAQLNRVQTVCFTGNVSRVGFKIIDFGLLLEKFKYLTTTIELMSKVKLYYIFKLRVKLKSV